MKVTLKTITPDIENTIVEIARVSSSRSDKKSKPEGLLNYLIKNKHWSPFEHGSVTFEIETSKAIGIQLIRHRSFTFQEFSQRYQDVNELAKDDSMFEPIELRRQAINNRQSSEEVFNPTINDGDAEGMINGLLELIKYSYDKLIEAGVAREQARMILPMTTKTKIFMTGSVRSWLHFLELRDDAHAQKEIQLIAKEIKSLMIKELPIISNALGWG